jgi:hypothetical protein
MRLMREMSGASDGLFGIAASWKKVLPARVQGGGPNVKTTKKTGLRPFFPSFRLVTA